MSNNVFKNGNNTRRQIEDRNRYVYDKNDNNSFKFGSKQKKQDFRVIENEFPDLCSQKKIEPKETEIVSEKTLINFKSLTWNKKIEIENQSDELAHGWVRLSCKHGKILYEYVPSTYVEYFPSTYIEETKEEDFQYALNKMIKNWENYKINYINLYGEDTYEKYYGLNETDNEEEDETDNEEEDETNDTDNSADE